MKLPWIFKCILDFNLGSKLCQPCKWCIIMVFGACYMKHQMHAQSLFFGCFLLIVMHARYQLILHGDVVLML